MNPLLIDFIIANIAIFATTAFVQFCCLLLTSQYAHLSQDRQVMATPKYLQVVSKYTLNIVLFYCVVMCIVLLYTSAIYFLDLVKYLNS